MTDYSIHQSIHLSINNNVGDAWQIRVVDACSRCMKSPAGNADTAAAAAAAEIVADAGAADAAPAAATFFLLSS